MSYLHPILGTILIAGVLSISSNTVSVDLTHLPTPGDTPLTDTELLAASKFLSDQAQQIEAGADYKEIQNTLRALSEVIEAEADMCIKNPELCSADEEILQ